jgi:hypothetical protein
MGFVQNEGISWIGPPLYFRQNVQVEPLSDSWYAWPHLIPVVRQNVPRTIKRHLYCKWGPDFRRA